MVTEPGLDRRDVGDPAGIGEWVAGDLCESLGASGTRQVPDVRSRERYDGLTPVIITL
jgi:hypothetical protein